MSSPIGASNRKGASACVSLLWFWRGRAPHERKHSFHLALQRALQVNPWPYLIFSSPYDSVRSAPDAHDRTKVDNESPKKCLALQGWKTKASISELDSPSSWSRSFGMPSVTGSASRNIDSDRRTLDNRTLFDLSVGCIRAAILRT